jgi:hypothetical protein
MSVIVAAEQHSHNINPILLFFRKPSIRVFWYSMLTDDETMA